MRKNKAKDIKITAVILSFKVKPPKIAPTSVGAVDH